MRCPCWANSLDKQTTDCGSTETSSLNCVDFDAGNCPWPGVLCPQYTPPALFHVAKVMATAYTITRTVFDAFQRSVIKEKLNSAKLISDFGPAQSDFNLFSGLNRAFDIAAGLASASGAPRGPALRLHGHL